MGQALDILHLLNEGDDVCDMLGGQFDFTQFKGRLKIELAAVTGHSFGGSTVVQTLSEEPRFRLIKIIIVCVLCSNLFKNAV